MRNLWTIARREIASYFTSPIFWVVATVFMVFSGFLFGYILNSPNQQAEMTQLLGLYGTVMLFAAPVLAMKLLAEEQRTGTLEVLMTSPLNDWQVVWGKWLGALCMFVGLMSLTLAHVAILLRYAEKGMDWGPLLASYLGLFLLGGMLLALGVLTSSVTQNQAIAAFLGIMLVMVLWFLSLVNQIFTNGGWIVKSIGYLGLSDHFGTFGQGIIDSRDIVYMVTLTIGALFLATRILESRRWR